MASDLELTIAEIASDMGLATGIMVFGEHEEAKRMSPPQIAWRLPRIQTRRTDQQEDTEADTVCKTSVPVSEVVIWAKGTAPGVSPAVSDFEAMWSLYSSLVASLFNLYGENVFEFADGLPSRESKHSTAGIAYTFQVGIKFPIRSTDLARHTAITALVAGEITDPQGLNPEAL
jgi:hypothetical protein